MLNRINFFVLVATIFCGTAFADDLRPALTIGDLVQLELTGDAAREYANFHKGLASKPNQKDLSISTTAIVRSVNAKSGVYIEHQTEIAVANERQLFTFTGNLPLKHFQLETTLAGTPIAASPGGETTLSKEATQTIRLQIDDLSIFDNFKLRRWKLVDEATD